MVAKTTKKLKTILFVGCLGTGLYWLFALIEGGNISGRLRFGTMFDPNDLAFFTLSFLPFNLIFLSKDNNWLKRFLCLINFVVGVLVILLSGSRGGFIGFFFVFVMLFLTKTKTFKFSYKIILAALIMIIVLTGTITVDFVRYQNIVNLEDDYNITSETGRLEVWKTGLEVMLSRPLTGVGFGCFNEAIGTDREERGLTPRWQAAHNSLIQIGAETGIIGLILFALMSFKTFVIFGQVKKKAGATEELIKISEMARVGFVGHFISAMFLSQAYSIYWAFYIVLSAVVDRLLEEEPEERLNSV
jgi:O-antigen ligase